MKVRFTYVKLVVLALLLSQAVLAQPFAGDYRSVNAALPAGGNWSDITKWERFDGTVWQPAATAPTSTDGTISIRTGDSIRINVPVTADQLVIDAGGVLAINQNPNNLTLVDGAGTDLLINGKLLLRSLNTLASSVSTVTVVVNGQFDWFSGILQAPTTISAAGTMFLDLQFGKELNADLINNGTFIWATQLATGSIVFNNATFTNNGTLHEFFESNRGMFPNSGTNAFINNGTVVKHSAFSLTNNLLPFTNNGGLEGTGSFSLTGTVSNTGTITPGGTNYSNLGVTANALTGQTGTVWISILDGTTFDVLNVTGAVNLTGNNLVIVEYPPTTPLQSYTILTSTGTITGTFSSVNMPAGYTIQYNANDVTVTKTQFTVLPLAWGDFSALAKNNQVQLKWSTLQEVNTSHFVVEYSIDGVSYSPIGSVAASGNSTVQKDYTFMHSSPTLNRNNFYRIKQYDIDDRNTNSPVRTVRFQDGKVVTVLAAPNPMHDKLQLTVQTDGISIRLVDLSGRAVKSMNLQPGTQQLNVEGLSNGIYQLIILQDNKQIGVQKLVKQ